MKFCKRGGFTLLELLVVIAIVAILALVIYGAYGAINQKLKVAHAENTLKSISVAMEAYRSEFNAYPPDDSPAGGGSEALWYYLCRVHRYGEVERGPYLNPRESTLRNSPNGSGKKLSSPLGGDYKYSLLVDSDGVRRMFLLIDPGLDKQLGGTINPATGFTPTNAKLAKDNLDSLPLAAK